MPHAVSASSPGLQALVLCGPGSSFPTFTSDPDKYPKALLPIANRPMVWYPLTLCYEMGVADITLVCPKSAEKAINEAFSRDPHLTTSLPMPKPSFLFPEDLEQTTGTAEILRLPAVRDAITTNFVLLPCDLVCEVPGEKLLQAWMVKGASMPETLGPALAPGSSQFSGGLSVYYETKTALAVKKEETDFIATSPLPPSPTNSQKGSLLPHLSKIVYSMPKDTLKDQMDEKNGLSLRHGLIRRHPRLRMRTTYRDAHFYIFPRWILDFVKQNERLESISEDLLGWWAKAGWQAGLAEKLGLDDILREQDKLEDSASSHEGNISPQVTHGPTATSPNPFEASKASATYHTNAHHDIVPPPKPEVPPIYAYVHPSQETAPLIRRVDTAQMLLNVNLHLAKLLSAEEAGPDAHAWAHPKKVSYPEGVKPRTTITKQDSLVGNNVLVEEKVAVKESVIGANCQLKEGAKISQCVLMDGVVVGKNCKLTKCVLGSRCKVGDGSVLTNCEVQENYLVETKTEEKDGKLMSSEGLEATDEEARGVLEDMDEEVQAANEVAP